MTRLEALRERYARGELSLEDFEANVGQLLAEERENAPAEVIGGRHDGAPVLTDAEWRERFERRREVDPPPVTIDVVWVVVCVALSVGVPLAVAIIGAYLALKGAR